jgi:hypothetical protein
MGQSALHRHDPWPFASHAPGALAFVHAAQAAVQITAVEATASDRVNLRQSFETVNGNVLLKERGTGGACAVLHAPKEQAYPPARAVRRRYGLERIALAPMDRRQRDGFCFVMHVPEVECLSDRVL